MYVTCSYVTSMYYIRTYVRTSYSPHELHLKSTQEETSLNMYKLIHDGSFLQIEHFLATKKSIRRIHISMVIQVHSK